MQFNSNADNQDLISDVTFLLGGLDTNAFTLKDRTRCMNERYRQIWQWIFMAYGGWQFMDDNSSDVTTGIPEAAQNLTSGTNLYALPSAALSVRSVEFKDSSSNWYKLYPLTNEQITTTQGLDNFQSTSGTPKYYTLYGDVIRIYPTPNFSVTSGLKIQFDQDISTFASTDTTKVPGFASVFHRALSVGAALDYAVSHSIAGLVPSLSVLWNDYEKRIKEFYSRRFTDKFPTRVTVRDAVIEFK